MGEPTSVGPAVIVVVKTVRTASAAGTDVGAVTVAWATSLLFLVLVASAGRTLPPITSSVIVLCGGRPCPFSGRLALCGGLGG